MTRQVSILIFSLIVIIFGGMWETKYINESCNYVLSDIEYMQNALNNNNMELALNSLKEVESSWKNVKDAWNIFVQNDLTSEIDDSLIKLKAYVEVENIEESKVTLKELRENLVSITRRQKLCLENVF